MGCLHGAYGWIRKMNMSIRMVILCGESKGICLKKTKLGIQIFFSVKSQWEEVEMTYLLN